MAKVVTVWTNGRAVRKWTGQDKYMNNKDRWHKKVALIMIEEEYEEYKGKQNELEG